MWVSLLCFLIMKFLDLGQYPLVCGRLIDMILDRSSYINKRYNGSLYISCVHCVK